MAKILQFNNGKMEIKNKTEDSAEMYIYGDIVSDDWKWDDTEVCPRDVIELLDAVKNVKTLDIYINSGGGSVFAGMAIYNLLSRCSAYKTVHVDGLAASIASVIAMAGDKVIIPSNAYFMIHKASAVAIGNSDDMLKMADTLEKIEEGILNVYKNNLKEGVDIDTIKQFMQEETWFTGDEASNYFNIEVSDKVEAVACVSDLTSYAKAPKLAENVQEELQNEVDNFASLRKKLYSCY